MIKIDNRVQIANISYALCESIVNKMRDTYGTKYKIDDGILSVNVTYSTVMYDTCSKIVIKLLEFKNK